MLGHSSTLSMADQLSSSSSCNNAHRPLPRYRLERLPERFIWTLKDRSNSAALLGLRCCSCTLERQLNVNARPRLLVRLLVGFIPSHTIFCRCLDPKLLPSYFVIAPISSSYLTQKCMTQVSLVCGIELGHEKNCYCCLENTWTKTSLLLVLAACNMNSQSDRGLESEPESSSGLDEGSECIEDEDEQEQVRLQPSENEVKGDFEWVFPVNCQLRRLGTSPWVSSYMVASLVRLENSTVNDER